MLIILVCFATLLFILMSHLQDLTAHPESAQNYKIDRFMKQLVKAEQDQARALQQIVRQLEQLKRYEM